MDVIEMVGLKSLPCSRNHVNTRSEDAGSVRRTQTAPADDRPRLVERLWPGTQHVGARGQPVRLFGSDSELSADATLTHCCLPQLSPHSASLPSPIGLLDETKLSLDMFPIDCTRSACSEHARDMIDAYLANLPKHSAKRGRQSMGTPSKPPAKRGRPSKASLAAKAIEDEEITFPDTHTDSADKFMDVADWEPIVKQVDSIERGSNNDLAVYLTM